MRLTHSWTAATSAILLLMHHGGGGIAMGEEELRDQLRIEQQLATRDAAAAQTAASMTRFLWLAGIALPCKGDEIGRGATQAIVDQYAGPRFHVRLNVYDSNSSCLPPHPYVSVSHIPGYMTLFWKHVLVPSLTRKYDRIFILDNDVKLSPILGFSLGAVDRWLALTGAMVLQPSVIGSSRAKRAGTGVRSGPGTPQHTTDATAAPPRAAGRCLLGALACDPPFRRENA